MSVLSVRDFSFSYGKKEVISCVNFDVNEGDAVVLIGANGAGKSTVIKSVARVLKAPENTIFLFDKQAKEYKPRIYAQMVSYVPQTPQFASGMVLNAVVLGRLPSFSTPSKLDYAEAYSALERVGIAHLATQNVLNLSGGEKQKVALARALCSQPRLILLDEPTSNLDLQSQYGLLKIIKELSQAGVSFLLSLHDVNQAVATGNKFVLLKDRKQAASGGEEVMSQDLLEEVFGLRFEKIYHGNQIHFHIKEKNENG